MARLSSSSPPLVLPDAANPASSLSSAATSPAPPGDHPPTPSSSASASSIHTVSSSKRPRLWSRLSLPKPLSSRNRNRYLADFHVRPDEPHRKYSPGDHVRGTVHLVVVKPVRITHLVVTLHGYVHVVRDPSAAAKSIANGPEVLPRGGNAGPQYHGNGFATLFQDEQVLSGDGKLELGKYDFEFDLIFPSQGLPSSIDFERGTISYMITATLTRPNPITPVTSVDRKIMLVAQRDISQITAPAPQIIWLEPTRKNARSRRKRSMGFEKVTAVTPDPIDHASDVDPMDSAEVLSHDPRDHHSESRTGDQSDLRSEVSGESGRSTSTGLSRVEMAQLSQVPTSVTSAAKQQEVNKKTISATIETTKGGFVAGDTVSVRISIRHHKHIKSMSGIIVTLFRLCRINLSPSTESFNASIHTSASDLFNHDGIVPRSRTGLGGFSLSSSGGTSVYRKDLDQNTVPLIIDPLTLSSTISASLKFPDDSFPSITGVPGNMVSFTYHVEAILDLGGRMANQYQGPHSSRTGPLGSGTSDSTNASYGPRRGASIADTTHIRRMEGVFSCGLNLVVGTMDSARTRKRGKSAARASQAEEETDEEQDRPEQRSDDLPPSTSHVSGHPAESYFPPLTNGHVHGSPRAGFVPGSEPPRPSYQHANGFAEASPMYVPPPQIPDANGMTEKERIRQAETRLLPSQPPAGESSGTAPAEDDLYGAEDTPRLQALSLHSPTEDDAEAGPSAPTADILAGPAPAPAEDKQELERQRLINEASAPPEFPEDMDRTPDGPSRPDTHVDVAPTAPMLDENDDYSGYGVGAGPSIPPNRRSNPEQLPAYER